MSRARSSSVGRRRRPTLTAIVRGGRVSPSLTRCVVRTKLVCTIGPASRDRTAELVAAGMDVARLNFSHGSPASRAGCRVAVRRRPPRRGQPVAILADLSGPEDPARRARRRAWRRSRPAARSRCDPSTGRRRRRIGRQRELRAGWPPTCVPATASCSPTARPSSASRPSATIGRHRGRPRRDGPLPGRREHPVGAADDVAADGQGSSRRPACHRARRRTSSPSPSSGSAEDVSTLRAAPRGGTGRRSSPRSRPAPRSTTSTASSTSWTP